PSCEPRTSQQQTTEPSKSPVSVLLLRSPAAAGAGHPRMPGGLDAGGRVRLMASDPANLPGRRLAPAAPAPVLPILGLLSSALRAPVGHTCVRSDYSVRC